LANSPQARKRARQNTVRRLRNASQRARMRTAIKNFLKAMEGQDTDKARSAYRNAASLIDKATHKNLHHKNRAARLKARLNNRLRGISTAP
jgi:small subunit ribosomal protein S20